MQNTKIKKDELVKIVTDNRAKHIAEHKTAIEGWKVQLTKEAKKLVKNIKKNADDVTGYIALPRPQSYETSYDSILKKLSLTQDETIELTDQDFSMLVEDNWHFKAHFSASNSAYSVTDMHAKTVRRVTTAKKATPAKKVAKKPEAEVKTSTEGE